MTRRAFCAGAAFLAAAAALPLAGCERPALHRVAAPVRLVVKVPRTGHDVVFDDSISQVEMVIQGMADEFQRTYARPVDVEVIVFEQNQYDEAVEGSFDTDKAPDVLYGDYFNISTYIRTGRVVPLDDVARPGYPRRPLRRLVEHGRGGGPRIYDALSGAPERARLQQGDVPQRGAWGVRRRRGDHRLVAGRVDAHFGRARRFASQGKLPDDDVRGQLPRRHPYRDASALRRI